MGPKCGFTLGFEKTFEGKNGGHLLSISILNLVKISGDMKTD